MIHAFNVRNAFDINNTQEITGITNSIQIPGTEYNFVTEKSVVDFIIASSATTLTSLTDTTIITPITGDILTYNGTVWVNSATTFLSDYYTKIESENKFVDVAGDTITGDLDINGTLTVTGNTTIYGNIITDGTVDGVDVSDLSTTVVNHTTSTTNPHSTSVVNLTDTTIITPTTGDILTYNGTIWVNSATTFLSNYYTKIESENKFVDVAGDIMTGTLNINPISGNAITTTGDVVISGDLIVSGTTTTLNTENLSIADNLMLLNSGETGAGVSNLTAGFLVDRGTSSAVTLCFDESTFTIRVGETVSTIDDNTIDLTNTVALTARDDSMVDSAITYWNGNRLYTSSITIVGGNIVTSGLVDGVDVSVLSTTVSTLSDTVTGINNSLTSHTNDTDNPHSTSVVNLTDTTINSASNGDLLTYSGGQWINSTKSVILSDYYTKTDVDNNFLSGDTTVTDLGGYTTSEVDNNFLSGDTTVTDLGGYTTSAADNAFVGVGGDTMSGDLIISTLSGTNERIVYVDSDGRLQESDGLLYKVDKTGIGTGVEVIDTFIIGTSKGAEWQYVIDDGTNYRAGTVRAVWDGTNIEWDETSTRDIGNTNNFRDFSVDITTGSIRLTSDVSSSTWNVSVRRTMI